MFSGLEATVSLSFSQMGGNAVSGPHLHLPHRPHHSCASQAAKQTGGRPHQADTRPPKTRRAHDPMKLRNHPPGDSVSYSTKPARRWPTM